MFDAESKYVLHTEMAKKNLFVKRGMFSLSTWIFIARYWIVELFGKRKQG